MATDILEIYNLTLVRLGEERLAAIDANSDLRRKLDAIYDNVLEQVTVGGPEKGWKFTKKRLPVDVDSSTITSFADYSGTVSGTVLATTSSVHNLVTGDLVNQEDTTNYNDEYRVTVVNTTTYYFTEDWNGDDATGTVYWTSDEYAYRYAMPSAALRVTSVNVGGLPVEGWATQGEWILTSLEDETIYVEYVQSIIDTTLFPSHFTKVLYMSLAVELSYSLIQSSTHSERLLKELQEIILPKAIALDEQEKYVAESNDDWAEAGR